MILDSLPVQQRDNDMTTRSYTGTSTMTAMLMKDIGDTRSTFTHTQKHGFMVVACFVKNVMDCEYAT